MTSLFRRSWGTLIALGVLAVVFGLVASIWPIETTAVLVTLWGVYALVDGVMALMLAFSEAGRSARGWLIFVGAIGVVAGLLAIFRPFSSAAALAWILGIWLITRGVLEVISAFGDRENTSRWLAVLSGLLCWSRAASSSRDRARRHSRSAFGWASSRSPGASSSSAAVSRCAARSRIWSSRGRRPREEARIHDPAPCGQCSRAC